MAVLYFIAFSSAPAPLPPARNGGQGPEGGEEGQEGGGGPEEVSAPGQGGEEGGGAEGVRAPAPSSPLPPPLDRARPCGALGGVC